MKSLWLICLVVGVFGFVATWLFSGNPKSRFSMVVFGKKGARIFFRLLGLGLVGLGLYLGKANQWALTGPPPYEIEVQGAWPGHHDARQTSATLAAPLGAEFNRLPGVTQVISEARPEGGYRCSITFHPKWDPERAKQDVDSAINAGYSALPSDLQWGLVSRGKLSPVRESDKIGIVVIRKSMDADESSLRELARVVAKRLVDEHAVSAVDSLDDQIPSGATPPVLVVRVERWPAVRITGTPPAGARVRAVAVRCLELAEMERAKRADAGDFETEILGSRNGIVPPLRDGNGIRYSSEDR